MKIALISPYDFPYPGGVTEHIIGLANGMRQQGHEVHILAACSGYQGTTFPNTRIVAHQVTDIPIGGVVARVGLSPLSYCRVKQILDREAFEVIHLHEPLVPGINWFSLMQAHRLPGAAIIGTFHAYHDRPQWLYKHGRPLFNKFFAKLDGLIAVSRAAYKFAYQMFPGDYRIIPNGIDLSRFSPKRRRVPAGDLSSLKQKTTILFVGRLDRRKGFSDLLEAFIKIKPDYPHLALQVVGPFEPEMCRPYLDIVRSQQIPDIEFVGYVSPEALPAVYHNADIFCAPSVGDESFGIVLLEAMTAGLPVIASEIPGYCGVISQGQEGLLTPPGHPTYLADALRCLVDNPYLRQTMGRRGQLKASQYSWEYIVNQVLEVYMNILDRKLSFRSKFWPCPEAKSQLLKKEANSESKSC